MKKRKQSQNLEALSDVEVMERARDQDTEAFGVLVRRYQDALLNFFRRLGVHTDAEDLVQESFLRVYRRRHSYKPTAKFSTFLYRVGKTVWIDWVRRKSRREIYMLKFEEDCAARSPEVSHRAQAIMDAQTAVNSLPEKLRLVVVMNIYQGMKYSEIAEALELPVGTVKSRMSIAFGRLKEFMHAGVESTSSKG